MLARESESRKRTDKRLKIVRIKRIKVGQKSVAIEVQSPSFFFFKKKFIDFLKDYIEKGLVAEAD